jgi:hypothetical protein
VPAGHARGGYLVASDDGRSTEDLVAAGDYGYAHSCVTSDSFPARRHGGGSREVVLLDFEKAVSPEQAVGAAAALGLERPVYEDALYFGARYPGAQLEGPVVFLHDPWFGFFGRRDVICLWANAGRRELGLEGWDDARGPHYRYAFVRPATPAS